MSRGTVLWFIFETMTGNEYLSRICYNFSMRALLFFDIDGTLITRRDPKLPGTLEEALAKARENGCLLYINTGRTRRILPPTLTGFPFSGYLCGCGTQILTEEEGELFHSTISPEKSRRLIDLVYDCGLEMLLECADHIIFARERYRIEPVEYIRKVYLDQDMVDAFYIDDWDRGFDKCMVFYDAQSDMERFTREAGEFVKLCDYRTGTCECIQKEYSKATAIEFMRQHYHVDDDQIYVFGDGVNDLDMFRCSKHTIAPREHDPRLDPYTEYVTDSVENDGIRKALEHYHLI